VQSAADALSAKTGWALPVPHPACHRHVLGVLGPFHGCQRIDRVLWMSCEMMTQAAQAPRRATALVFHPASVRRTEPAAPPPATQAVTTPMETSGQPRGYREVGSLCRTPHAPGLRRAPEARASPRPRSSASWIAFGTRGRLRPPSKEQEAAERSRQNSMQFGWNQMFKHTTKGQSASRPQPTR